MLGTCGMMRNSRVGRSATPPPTPHLERNLSARAVGERLAHPAKDTVLGAPMRISKRGAHSKGGCGWRGALTTREK